MPTISQPPAQDLSATAVQKQDSIPLVIFIASVVLYISLLILGTWHGYRHLHLMLLAFQYLVILPITLWFLKPSTGSTASSVPAVNIVFIVVAFALVAIPLSRFSAQGLLNPDESGYAFQARLYRSGRIMAEPLIGATANVRQTPAELSYGNHILSPRGWFPKFPPGWPLVLSLGYLISAPWLLNPVFGVLQLVCIAVLAKLIFNPPAGALAVFFAVLSPFFLVNSIGMMSHAFCALLSAVACMALFSALKTGSLWYYAGMFACLATALQVRPYTGFVLTLVLTAAALFLNRNKRTVLMRVLSIGAFFGAIALACVLLYNHAYTGNWFVSPYAMAVGASTPPELSFNAERVWQGIRHYAPQTIEESLIGSFPFVYLLAGYALLREKERRKEVWILGLVYISLVLAYLAHPDGSGVFFGERFHFEGFFAVLLLAARGLQLLAECWRMPRHALIWTMFLFAAMQITQQTAAITTVARRGEPYRKVRAALTASTVTGLVFLHDGPGFVAKHFNLNDADWRNASRVYLIDAEPDHRDEWSCRYGFGGWTAVTYDPQSKQAVLISRKTNCGNEPKLH